MECNVSVFSLLCKAQQWTLRCLRADLTCRWDWECTDKRRRRSNKQLRYIELRRRTQRVLQVNAGWPHQTSRRG